MPTILWVGKYVIFFWSNENRPREPVHVHVAFARQSSVSAKIWITSEGEAVLCHNNALIPPKTLRKIMRFVEAYSADIIEAWEKYFGEVRYIR